MIEESGAEVANGGRRVEVASSHLALMLQAARNSNELVTAIANESQTQAVSIEQINASVQHVEGMTQRVLVPEGHSVLVVSSRVAALAARFFEHGRFD